MRAGRRNITKVVLNPDGSVRTRVREERIVHINMTRTDMWFEPSKNVRSHLKLDGWGHLYYETTATSEDQLLQQRQKDRKAAHVSLSRAEVIELDELYNSFYETEQRSLRDLQRMYYLEQKGTDTQVARLLKKHGLTLTEEFDS